MAEKTTLEDKVFDAVTTLLATGERISAYSLTRHMGYSRTALDYYVKKKKQQIQTKNKG